MQALQIYSGFRLGILSYDVATYLYLPFSAKATIFALSNFGINPCFPSYHAMITTRVETVDD